MLKKSLSTIMSEAAVLIQVVGSMLDNTTIEKPMDLKLKAMTQMMREHDHILEGLSFEDRLAIMVEKEQLAKKNAMIKRLLKSASLGLNACIEDIDYSPQRTIDKQVIKTLSTCNFIDQKLNIVISGKTGSGKTYLACAFENNACRHEYTVNYRFYHTPGIHLTLIVHNWLKMYPGEFAHLLW